MKSDLTLMRGTQAAQTPFDSRLSWLLNSKQKESLHGFGLFRSQHKYMRSHLLKTVLFWGEMAFIVVLDSQTLSDVTQSWLGLSSCHHLIICSHRLASQDNPQEVQSCQLASQDNPWATCTQHDFHWTGTASSLTHIVGISPRHGD
jgi:hypothetical protein